MKKHPQNSVRLDTAWKILESIPDLTAPVKIWHARLGQHLDAFKPFLDQLPNGQPGAQCRLNWPKLSRALASVLGLDLKSSDFPLPATRQIGSWSAAAVPAILTIQPSPRELRAVIAELVARLRQPFILLAPTTTHLTAPSQELLATCGAAFFALDACATFTATGGLQPTQCPGELFGRFQPDVTEPDGENIARQVVAVVKALDSARSRYANCETLKASPMTVLRLYCIEGLSKKQIAARCDCALSLVYARLEQLRKKLGRDPAELRPHSAHLDRVEEALSDHRARVIRRKDAIYGDEPQRH